MTTKEVAEKLVGFCRKGQYEQAQKELYDSNAISIEPKGAQLEFAQGAEALKAKGEQWEAMVEQLHSAHVSDPIVAENFFSVNMINDVTFKGMGRQTIEEICVYEVNNGKIVKEQFFYSVPPQQ